MIKQQKILVSVINNISTDQRVEKVCNSLLKNGYEILLIGTNLNGLPPLRKSYKTQRFTLLFQKKILLFAEFNFKLFWKLLFLSDKNTILLANDLDTLLPNYLISKFRKIPLVFDSHEIYSELPSIQGKFSQKVWRKLEKHLLPKMNHFYTVSEGYANFFENKYGIRPVVIKNVPFTDTDSNKKKEITIKLPKNPQNNKIVIYQGAINYSRGIDKMIEAMCYLTNTQLWIIGNGPLKKEYENLRNTLHLENCVYFLGEIPPEQLKVITPIADLGLSLEEDRGLSYRYALPNKLFDYIHAKIPILGTYLPEIKNIITHYSIGKTIDHHNPEHIAKQLELLLKETKYYYQNHLEKAMKEFCWKEEELKLIELFNSI